MPTPAARGLRMPAEWAPHERTLMAWPCRRELWEGELEAARSDYAAVANAIAAFEPVTMVCGSPADAAAARAALAAACEVVELPIDDSWLRDNGPVFVTGGGGERVAVDFGFNAWGGKFTPWDRDAALGVLLAQRLGDEVLRCEMVLEGGSVAVDGEGALVTTRQCLLHASRNPGMDAAAIEAVLGDQLGAERVVWLGDGLAEDRDTDGHVDMCFAFTAPGRGLLQSAPPGEPDHEPMAANREILEGAGIEAIDFPLLAHVEVAGERAVCSYLNFYLCNGGAVVPMAGAASDEEALERIGAAYPDREAVGVPGAVIAHGGGGPHCITQQVPARSA